MAGSGRSLASALRRSYSLWSSNPAARRRCSRCSRFSRTVPQRANYGFSPGDDHHAEPYAYISPWTAEVRGELWQATGFRGAELTYAELRGASDPRAAALDFFTTRKEALA